MKNVLKSLSLGFLEIAGAFLAIVFLSITVEAFLAIFSATGWLALAFFASGILCGVLFLFIVFCMGAAILVPLQEAKDLKERLDNIDD